MTTLPFFRSRWVPAPAHVRELGLDAGLPGGFRAAGVPAGIKLSGKPDVGLLVCDSRSPVSAARFTATAMPAAPVLLSRERCRLGALRAVLANSGCANAATGRRGLEDAAKTQGAAALAVGVDPAEVALASTGGISHELPVDAMLQGILGARQQLRREGDGDFQQAIQTTDLFEKRANLELQLPSGVVRLSAQCKGAGMISPRFATMLCFVETDAALAPETADLLLGVCVKRSFDRASVDGQLSTNDTAILMCSAASARQHRPRERGRAALRRGARRTAARARDHDGRRRRGRRADRARGRARRRSRRRRGGRPRGGQLAARQGRAARRRPQLGADRAGRRRRPRRTPGLRRAACRGRRDRGHPGLLGGRRDRLRRASARTRRAGRRGRVRDRAARRSAPRPRSSSQTSRTST